MCGNIFAYENTNTQTQTHTHIRVSVFVWERSLDKTTADNAKNTITTATALKTGKKDEQQHHHHHHHQETTSTTPSGTTTTTTTTRGTQSRLHTDVLTANTLHTSESIANHRQECTLWSTVHPQLVLRSAADNLTRQSCSWSLCSLHASIHTWCPCAFFFFLCNNVYKNMLVHA